MNIGGLPSYSSGFDYYKKSELNLPPKSAIPDSDGNKPAVNGIIEPSTKRVDGKDKGEKVGDKECKTCESRSYRDVSNDPGVSFKTPTKISPGAAGSMVMAHEQQHVTRNRSKAEREDREVVSSSVSIHTSICNECGKPYVSGGTTRTVTANKNRFDVGKANGYEAGKFLNTTA